MESCKHSSSAKRGALVFLILALVAVDSCSRSKKSDPQAALDNAFQAGLLTKDEYDAKKAAFAASSAAPAPLAAPAAGGNVSPADFAPAQPVFVQDSAPPAKQAQLPPPVASPVPQAAPQVAAPLPVAAASSPSRVATSSVGNVSPPSSPADPSASSTPSALSSREPAAGVREPAAEPSAEASEPAPAAGCEDAEFKSGGRKGRESRFFAAPATDVRRAAEAAFGSLDFNVHKNTGQQMEATRKRNIGVLVGAGGEHVVLKFQKTTSDGQAGTLVTGDTKKNFVGHVTQRTWTDAVLAEIVCKLRESGR
jgi:hypothetical protein